jgi:hypothetical protein
VTKLDKPHIRSTKTTNTPIKTPHHKRETQQEDHQATPWAQKAVSSRTLGEQDAEGSNTGYYNKQEEMQMHKNTNKEEK